jgi:hypothetical protein
MYSGLLYDLLADIQWCTVRAANEGNLIPLIICLFIINLDVSLPPLPDPDKITVSGPTSFFGGGGGGGVAYTF